MTELAELIPQILAKTDEGKLKWEALSNDNFISRLGDASLELSFPARGGSVRLALRDGEGRLLETASYEDISSPYDQQLVALYDRARRRALRIDEVVEGIKDKLDKL
jgi:hypothetical protein